MDVLPAPLLVISIHTPLAGSDAFRYVVVACSDGISIHTPLAGSDVYAAAVDRFGEDFNPHSPRGE